MAGARLRFFVALIASFWLANPAAAVIAFSQPKWKELSAEQRQILEPLAKEWDALDAPRRKKWLGIAQRYPSMTPEEKQRLQQRMREWATLSPDERNAARDTYRAIQAAPVEQRGQIKDTIRQQWEEYSALPDTEKARLNAEAQRKGSAMAPPPRRSNSSSIAVPLTPESGR